MWNNPQNVWICTKTDLKILCEKKKDDILKNNKPPLKNVVVLFITLTFSEENLNYLYFITLRFTD